MGKVLKGAAIGVGVIVAGLAIAATGGAALGPLLSSTLGGFFTAAGTVGGALGLTGFAAAAVGAGIIGGGLAALSYLQPGAPDVGTTGQDLTVGAQTVQNPDDYYVFGEAFFPFQRVYIEQHGSDDQSLLEIYHHASHRIASFDELYLNNDELISTGSQTWQDIPDGHLNILRAFGRTDQTAFNFNGVAWDSVGTGLAYTGWQQTQHPDKPDLISSNKRAYGKAAFNYDPRQDSTVGGSGSQRADDPTTWAYGGHPTTPQGSNLALVALRYVLGEWQNGKLRWGIGADPANIDYAAFIAAANFCDEIVNGEPRHHIAGSINCSVVAYEALKTIMGHCGGWCGRDTAGLWTIYIPQDDLATPDWTITAQDCMVPISLYDQPLSNIFNTVMGRCAPKDGKGQLVDYPAVSEAALVTADGGEFATPVDYPFYTSFERAQYAARGRLRRSRYDRRFETVLGFGYFRIRKYDTVEVNAPEFGILNEVMRVVARTIVPGQGIAVVLAEENSAIYDQTEPVAPNPTIGQVLGFDPSTAVAVAGLSLTAVDITGTNGDAQNAIRASWTAPSTRVAKTEVRWRIGTTGDFVYAPSVEFGTTETVIAGLPAQSSIQVQLRHITIFGVPGPWASATETSGNKVPERRVRRTIYRALASTPAQPTGGSFDFTTNTLTPPADWSESLPDSNLTRWAAEAEFISSDITDTAIAPNGAWSTLVRFVDDGANATVLSWRGDQSHQTGNWDIPYPAPFQPTNPGSLIVVVEATDVEGGFTVHIDGQSQNLGSAPDSAREFFELRFDNVATSTFLRITGNGSDGAIFHSIDVYRVGQDGAPGADGALPFGFKVNYTFFDTVNVGEIFIHGYSNEQVADVDGHFFYDGTKHTIARLPVASGGTVLTGIADKDGFVVYDISGANFTVGGSARSAAFVFKENDLWYYDDNDTTPVQFTPSSQHLKIGICKTGAADNIDFAAPIQPVPLLSDFGEPGRVERGTQFPSSPREAQQFYRTDLKTYFVYDGSSWVRTGGDLGAVNNIDAKFIENPGFSRLDENGNPLSWDYEDNQDAGVSVVFAQSADSVLGDRIGTFSAAEGATIFSGVQTKELLQTTPGEAIELAVRFKINGPQVSKRAVLGIDVFEDSDGASTSEILWAETLAPGGFQTVKIRYVIPETVGPRVPRFLRFYFRMFTVAGTGTAATSWELDFFSGSPVTSGDRSYSIADTAALAALDVVEIADGDIITTRSGEVYEVSATDAGTADGVTVLSPANAGDERIIKKADPFIRFDDTVAMVGYTVARLGDHHIALVTGGGFSGQGTWWWDPAGSLNNSENLQPTEHGGNTSISGRWRKSPQTP